MKKVVKAMVAAAIIASAFIGLSVCQISSVNAQGVSINPTGNQADPSAILDVSSTTKGQLMPRMTTAQRDAIVNPVQGLQIYNITTNCLNYYSGIAWFSVCGNCLPPAAPTSSNNSPVCEGSTLSLSASMVSGATYSWTGPNGFSSTLQNPAISSVTTPAGGTYSVTATIGCTSTPGTTSVTINSNPASIFTPSSGFASSPVTFTPTVSGAVYSWAFTNGSPSTSTTENPSVTWSSTGTYDVTLTVIQNGCSSTTTTAVNITPSIVSFTNIGTTSWTAPVGVTSVKVLMVGGGGAGGGRHGGGGGGGGVLYMPTVAVIPGTIYPIVVGAGAPTNTGGTSSNGANGENTTAFGEIAIGGGGGGSFCSGNPGSTGGSGGGAGHPGCGGNTGGAALQGNPVSHAGFGYGNAGADNPSSLDNGCGGGGAGAAGQAASNTYGGDGGAGVLVNIDGNNYYWGGGGAGAGYQGSTPGNGGIGGGGGGGYGDNFGATNLYGTGGGSAIHSGQNGYHGAPGIGAHGGAGGANTGGGGGGSGQHDVYGYVGNGGAGGSGIVIITY